MLLLVAGLDGLIKTSKERNIMNVHPQDLLLGTRDHNSKGGTEGKAHFVLNSKQSLNFYTTQTLDAWWMLKLSQNKVCTGHLKVIANTRKDTFTLNCNVQVDWN